MRSVLLVTAALVVAVIFFALATLPSRPRTVAVTLDPELVRRTIRGAYHIHTTLSDGAADKAAVAAAAARAGLKFVILTDHGDGTRPPDPPAYLSGVLCIDAVEISTKGGHYAALGMRAAPYPLGGEPSAVVEDVARLGGFGFAAHPDSARASLAWNDWTAPIDGIEWLNADSEWRDESRATLARVLFDYMFRPAPALASMFDRPVTTLKRWDDLAASRPIVGLAGHDAHGGIGRGVEENGARKRTLGHVPSYEASFRTFSNSVILDAPPTGDAAADARGVLDAIRRGRVFTVIDAIATPGFLDFRGWQGEIAPASNMGATLRPGPSVISVKATMPAGAEMVVIADGVEVHHITRPDFVAAMEPASGAVRIEVRVPGAPGTPPVPWLVGNPIYFLPASQPSALPPAPAVTIPLQHDIPWHVEKDPQSAATIAADPQQVSIRYTLAPGAKMSQFAALAADLGITAPTFRQLLFSAAASRPSRMSVQLRYPQGGGERWGRSVYLDSALRQIAVPVDQMLPLDQQAGPPPDPASASSLLFVADLTNARPGDSNEVRISNVRFGK